MDELLCLYRKIKNGMAEKDDLIRYDHLMAIQSFKKEYIEEILDKKISNDKKT